jgi:hypothetical protein
MASDARKVAKKESMVSGEEDGSDVDQARGKLWGRFIEHGWRESGVHTDMYVEQRVLGRGSRLGLEVGALSPGLGTWGTHC